jgi:urease accessory protein
VNFRYGPRLVAAAVLITQAPAAQAHIVASRLGDFYAGALHPLTDLQDIVLWLAIGVLAGSLGAARGRWLVLVFPLGLLTGLVLDRRFGLALATPAVNAGIILVLGLLLAAAARIPAALLCAIAFGLAVMRGAANAADFAPETDRLLFAAGLAGAGYAAITLIMALTLAFKRPDASPAMEWRGIAIRALGGWIAAIGLMMVGFAFAP